MRFHSSTGTGTAKWLRPVQTAALEGDSPSPESLARIRYADLLCQCDLKKPCRACSILKIPCSLATEGSSQVVGSGASSPGRAQAVGDHRPHGSPHRRASSVSSVRSMIDDRIRMADEERGRSRNVSPAGSASPFRSGSPFEQEYQAFQSSAFASDSSSGPQNSNSLAYLDDLYNPLNSLETSGGSARPAKRHRGNESAMGDVSLYSAHH